MLRILSIFTIFLLLNVSSVSSSNFNYGSGYAAKSVLASQSLINAMDKIDNRIYAVGEHGIILYSSDFGLGDKAGLHIRYKGDGRTFKMGVRLEGKSVSYRSNFTSGNGWQEVKIPFDEMVVSWRGRPLSKEVHPLVKSKIRSIEFMIYDKQDGPFKLKVDWIKSY